MNLPDVFLKWANLRKYVKENEASLYQFAFIDETCISQNVMINRYLFISTPLNRNQLQSGNNHNIQINLQSKILWICS